MLLGAGREAKDSIIDPTAGIILHKKIGDSVQQGDVIAELHYNAAYVHRFQDAMHAVQQAYTIGETAIDTLPLILDIIES